MFNVVRTQPPPLSLALQRDYAAEDVLKELQKIFHNKCYLCEVKDPTSLNVEHFDSHKNDRKKMFDWGNLYYVCGRCNNIKSTRFDNLLDCTDNTVDVFRAIQHIPPHSPRGKIGILAKIPGAKALETAKLLDEIYNSAGKTINKQITSVYLREKIFLKFNRFLKQVNLYINEESSSEVKAAALSTMKAMVGKEQEFSAFIRWVVLEDELLSQILSSEIK
jgi:hypothetical protein